MQEPVDVIPLLFLVGLRLLSESWRVVLGVYLRAGFALGDLLLGVLLEGLLYHLLVLLDVEVRVLFLLYWAVSSPSLDHLLGTDTVQLILLFLMPLLFLLKCVLRYLLFLLIVNLLLLLLAAGLPYLRKILHILLLTVLLKHRIIILDNLPRMVLLPVLLNNIRRLVKVIPLPHLISIVLHARLPLQPPDLINRHELDAVGVDEQVDAVALVAGIFSV